MDGGRRLRYESSLDSPVAAAGCRLQRSWRKSTADMAELERRGNRNLIRSGDGIDRRIRRREWSSGFVR
ncbi:hypothetical protein LINGRAPRIM_LOCUS1583 [Linum grandiflorum]